MMTHFTVLQLRPDVSLSVSLGQSTSPASFILPLPFMLSLCMLYFQHPSLAFGLVYPCKYSSINNYAQMSLHTGQLAFPSHFISFPSIFWWLSGPLILNPHVSRCGFNDPGECGSTSGACRLNSEFVVLGLWPENVFQINSVKSWMNLLTFVSDNVPWIGFKLKFLWMKY